MMSKNFARFFVGLVVCLALTACEKKFNPADGAPPQPQVIPTGDMSLVTVEKPGQFPVLAADRVEAAAELNVNRLGVS